VWIREIRVQNCRLARAEMIMAADATKEIQFEIGHVLFVPSLAAKE
jgi:hypothetical protein